jgi:hypothetical protein
VERGILAPNIYPGVETDVFQGNKIGNAIVSEHDSWFWQNHMGLNIAQVWKSGVNDLVSKVPSYLRYDQSGQLSGLTLFKSKLYQL